MSVLKTSRKYHKWLMLFLGLQFVVWSVTGAYMVFFDIDYIHGDSLIINHQNKLEPQDIHFSQQQLFGRYPDAKKHNLTLVQSRFVSPFIKELRFKVKSESSFSFKAGAFMRFFIPDASGVSKPADMPEQWASHWQEVAHFTYQHGGCSRSYSFAESSAGEQTTTQNRNIHFFYGARSETDLLYTEEFHQLSANNEQFNYYPTLSQAKDDWLGARG